MKKISILSEEFEILTFDPDFLLIERRTLDPTCYACIHLEEENNIPSPIFKIEFFNQNGAGLIDMEELFSLREYVYFVIGNWTHKIETSFD